MTSTPAAESAGLPTIVVCPRIAVRPRVIVEVAAVQVVVDVDVPVDIGVSVVVVVEVPVERVVVAVAAVVAPVVIATMPANVSVVCAAVIDDGRAVPAAVPAAVPPTAAASAHQGPHGNTSAEANDARSRHVAGGIGGSYITGNDIGIAVNHCGVVLRNVHNLWIGGLNDNGLRRLLDHGDLRAGLEGTLCFRLCAKCLNGCHHFRLLVVIRLSERGSPSQILRHVVEHRGKFSERLNAWVPRLLVDGLHQRAARKTLVLPEPVVSNGDLVREGRRVRIWATRESGYSAIGATNDCSSSVLIGAPSVPPLACPVA